MSLKLVQNDVLDVVGHLWGRRVLMTSLLSINTIEEEESLDSS